ncbi:ISNCY family transposase, partial [Microcystis aeruginosa BLCCF158]|nr:ISNCY family transposase [Microcystis aeruginosa BLCC-F158]
TEQNSPLVHLYSPVKRCGSHHAIKNGSIHNGKPKRQCKECSRQFVINPTNKTVSDETKQLSCS